MISDVGIRRLRRDVVRLMRDGWSANMVEENLDHLIDKASTRLTTEEKTVLLKWIEKNESRLSKPRGLDAYNRQSDKRWGLREATYHRGGKQRKAIEYLDSMVEREKTKKTIMMN
jgi:hypothetical protein